jgi:hypothetical protein
MDVMDVDNDGSAAVAPPNAEFPQHVRLEREAVVGPLRCRDHAIGDRRRLVDPPVVEQAHMLDPQGAKPITRQELAGSRGSRS